MARFCTKCGSPLQDTQKFCAKCGAPAGEAAAPAVTASAAPSPAAPAPAPAAAPPAAAPAAAAPTQAAPKGLSPVVKVVIGVAAFVVLMSVLALGTCVFIGYRARQRFNEMSARAKAESSTPGEINIQAGSQGATTEAGATKDVPAYPGATATQSGGSLSFGGAGGVVSQEYETADSVEQVLNFYKQKLGSSLRVVEAEGNAEFTYSTQTGITTVTITRDEDSGKTKIAIARIGK